MIRSYTELVEVRIHCGSQTYIYENYSLILYRKFTGGIIFLFGIILDCSHPKCELMPVLTELVDQKSSQIIEAQSSTESTQKLLVIYGVGHNTIDVDRSCPLN